MSEIEASGPKSRTTDLPPISQTYIALATLYPVAYTAASSTTDEGTHFAFGALALLVSLFIIGFALRYPLRLFLRRLRGRPRSESTQTETLGPIVIGILGLILFVAGAVQVGQGVAVRSQSEDVQQIGNVIEQVTLQEVQWYKNPSLTIPAGLSHYLAPPNEGGSDVQDLIGFVKKHLVDRNRRFAPDSSAVAFAPANTISLSGPYAYAKVPEVWYEPLLEHKNGKDVAVGLPYSVETNETVQYYALRKIGNQWTVLSNP